MAKKMVVKKRLESAKIKNNNDNFGLRLFVGAILVVTIGILVKFVVMPFFEARPVNSVYAEAKDRCPEHSYPVLLLSWNPSGDMEGCGEIQVVRVGGTRDEMFYVIDFDRPDSMLQNGSELCIQNEPMSSKTVRILSIHEPGIR